MPKGKTADEIDAEMALAASGAIVVRATTPSANLSPSALEAEYARLAETAAEVQGHDLIDDKAALLGMPFIVTGVTYRDGLPRKAAQGNKLVDAPTNYVSLEIMLGDSLALNRALERGKITIEQRRAYDPCERLVINDGSTGIYRQITAFLVAARAFEVGDGQEGGAAGESRYDRYRAEWSAVIEPFSEDDKMTVHFDLVNNPALVTLRCPRGLRRSDYDAAGQQSTTFYLG